MTTFFISSSSRPDIRERTLALAERLKLLGWGWYDDYCWADNFETAEDLAEPEDLQRRIEGNIGGAICADIFIMIDDPTIISRGSNIEFGARLAALKDSYIIGGESHPKYLFYLAPSVTLVKDEEALMEALNARS